MADAPNTRDDDGDDNGGGPETAILFVVISLLIGTISRQVLHRSKVPYTVVLLIIGMGLGAFDHAIQHSFGSFGQSVRLWANINPNLILYVFLPGLLFESSFSMEVHQIKRCLIQMVLLAGPGVIISTACLGVVNHYVFPYGWSWSVSLLLGGLLSATDPVAVVALLKDLGASKKLNTIIDGEALMNDGTAMVVFELFRQMTLGKHFSAGDIVQFLSKISMTAVALGLAFGMVTVLWINFMFNDTVMEITLTFTTSYLAFFIAQHVAKVSGVLAVMTVGMFFAAFAKTAFRGESQQAMHHFWNMVAYFSNTIIFILSGVVIAESFLESQSLIEARDWGYLLLLYVFLQLSRAIVVFVLYPGLRYYGYGLNLKEAIILIWSGLRGAVALALSLSVEASGSVSEKTRAKFVFFTGGVVFLTLIINGTSTQFLLRFLRIEKTTETKRLVLEHVTYAMNRQAVEALDELGEDEELGPADLTTVHKYISCLSRFQNEERPAHPHGPPTNEHSRISQLQDTRLRFLNGVQAAYWEMLEEGRITETAAMLLMQSVDEALDRVAKQEPLSDWKGLQPHIHIPSYLKKLQRGRILPQKILTYLIVSRLELACYISAAFLRAHVHVRRHLRDFIGETEICEAVIKESEEEALQAKQFLDDIRLTFSQVLRVVKTKQVVHAIVLRLSEYIKSLEKSGLLEERETMHLHDAVERELKKLLRHPPTVKISKNSEILRDQPFIASLPYHVQAQLVGYARENLKMRGNILYKQGSKAEGIWLIASGVVKWSKMDSNQLHPIFAHGSTLGLYEILVGRPYLCDLVAESVVECFFIEASKLLSVIQSEPNVEQVFWQESTLAVSKIILAKSFESLPIHELRSLIQTSSTTVSCLRGEVIELRPGETSLLLEGFVKTGNSNEIIAAPSAIIFANPHPDSTSAGVYYGNIINIEARSRLVIFKLEEVSHTASSMSLLPRRSSVRSRGNSFYRQTISPVHFYDSQKERGSTGQIVQEHNRRMGTRVGSLQNIPASSMQNIPVPRPLSRLPRPQASGESSEDEDEHIVQIESPSSLFHNTFNNNV